MASFSSGLVAGSSIVNDYYSRQDRLKQQAINNEYAERQMVLREDESERVASTHKYLNYERGLEERFASLKPKSGQSVVDMQSFSRDVQENGDVQAAANVMNGAFEGNPAAMLDDSNGQGIWLGIMKWSPKFNANADANSGWTPSKIVRVEDQSGEPRYMIGMEGPDGQQSAMTKGRGNDREPVLFSSADLMGLGVDGMRERGVFTNPEYMQQMRDSGFDIDATMRQYGGDTSNKIPSPSRLQSATEAVKITKKATAKGNLVQLNDGTVRPDHKQDTFTGFGPEQGAKDFMDAQVQAGVDNPSRPTNDNIDFSIGQRRDFISNPTPDDIAFQQSQNRDAVISDALGAVDNVNSFIADKGQRVVETLGTLAPERTLIEAGIVGTFNDVSGKLGRFAERGIKQFRETVSKPLANTVSTALFGTDSKKSEATLKGHEENATPEQKEEADLNTMELINSLSNLDRVKVGDKDVKTMSKSVKRQERNPSKNYKPTAKQMATAARMKANGLLSASAFELYLETGKFSLADINAATAENTSRTNALKAQTAAVRLAKSVGEDKAKEIKATYSSNLDANATLLEQSLNSVPAFRKMKDSHNFDLNKQAKAMLTVALNDSNIQKLMKAEDAFHINGKGMAIIADVIARDVLPEFHGGAEDFWARSVDPSVITSDKVIRAIKKRFKQDK